MKGIKIFAAVIIMSFAVSCSNAPKQDEEESNFDQQLTSFAESMSEIERTMDLVTYLNTKIQELDKQVENGELTREQANKLAEELNKTYQREIARRSNINPATQLPAWATELGLIEPVGLALDRDFSKQTSIDNKDEGFNSVKLVYIGDYQAAIEQAKRIASGANIPLSKVYAEAFQKAEKYPTALKEIKGISYMNYDPATRDIDFKMSVSVDENGVLTLIAVDEKQRRQFLSDKMEN